MNATPATRHPLPMPRPYTPPPRDTRPRLPSAPGPKPAVISRADTIVELRTIYRLIDQQLYAAAKSKLVLLGRNLQS